MKREKRNYREADIETFLEPFLRKKHRSKGYYPYKTIKLKKEEKKGGEKRYTSMIQHLIHGTQPWSFPFQSIS